MNVTFALNTVFGSFLVVFLIFADYARKLNVNSGQRKLFMCILILTAVSMVMNFIIFIFNGHSGHAERTVLWVAAYIYFIFQVAAYWYLFIFCVYSATKNYSTAKLLIKISSCIIAAHAVFLLFNFKFGVYYFISNNNIVTHGSMYFIRMIISYMPAAAALIAIIKTSNAARRTMIFLMLVFLLFIGVGTTLDIILGVNLFTWPCFAGSLLCSYLFIIKTDAKIDSLTGIGNRHSYTEFIERLARMEIKEKWNIMMIDMDHFKAINDVYGHVAGDTALKDMASIIKSCTHLSDFTARYGGDEFIIAINGDRDFDQFISDFQKAIEAHNESTQRDYKLEISYGCGAFTTGSGQIIQDFIEYIDSLMYKNKTERRKMRCSEA